MSGAAFRERSRRIRKRSFKLVIQRLLISAVPWLELIRTTLTPASSNARIWSGSSHAGPRVATILVRRIGALRDKSGTFPRVFGNGGRAAEESVRTVGLQEVGEEELRR